MNNNKCCSPALTSSTLTGQHIIDEDGFTSGAQCCPVMMYWLSDLVYLELRISMKRPAWLRVCIELWITSNLLMDLSARQWTVSPLSHTVHVELTSFWRTVETLQSVHRSIAMTHDSRTCTQHKAMSTSTQHAYIHTHAIKHEKANDRWLKTSSLSSPVVVDQRTWPQ